MSTGWKPFIIESCELSLSNNIFATKFINEAALELAIFKTTSTL